MAIKKSDLYSSLWASCDELRGGMDASQYKDYVLFILFIKYITDKCGDSTDFAPPVTIPKGASFTDMLALRGKSDIGDKINTQVIAPLAQANDRLARSDFPDFNDSNKLGEGQAKVERLTNLVNIFASPQLDFSQNRADHDDILGDAYEYLMRHYPRGGQPGHRQGDRHLAGQHEGVHHRLRPDLWLGLVAPEGGRQGREAHHYRRAGEGRHHGRLGPHEHDPARLPDG